MENIYQKTYTVNDLHLDCFGRVKPSVLLFFAQDVAGDHASLLGTGWDALAEKNLFWALIRHKIEITRLPVSGETITVQTWPMPTTRVAYPRATVAYDEKGQVLFRTIALWVLMDTQSRGMVLPGKSGVTVEGSIRGDELASPASITPKELENVTACTVGYTHLDRNGHMNNTRYLDWACDLLGSRFHQDHPARQINVCYLAEAKESQRIDLQWALTEGNLLQVEATRKSALDTGKQERVFALEAQF